MVIKKAHFLREKLREKFQNFNYEVTGDLTPLIPVLIKDSKKVMDAVGFLDEKGVNVAGIRYPTVPPLKARLRISCELL